MQRLKDAIQKANSWFAFKYEIILVRLLIH